MQNSELEHKELARAKNTVYRFLSIRPRSRVEIEKKLRDKEFSPSVIDTVMDHLLRLGYVDDAKFAGQWASARNRLRGYGRYRIEQELRGKGVSAEIIRETLHEFLSDATEVETAKRAARKKLGTMNTQDRETCRRRLAGFLERKGFSYDIIRNVLKEIG